MYKVPTFPKTTIKRRMTQQGETIEQKIERITHNKEPIKDGAPLIYTERKEGVQPGYDIRTDRFEVAIEAMDKVSEVKRHKRAERLKGKVIDMEGNEVKKEGETPSSTSTGDQK